VSPLLQAPLQSRRPLVGLANLQAAEGRASARRRLLQTRGVQVGGRGKGFLVAVLGVACGLWRCLVLLRSAPWLGGSRQRASVARMVLRSAWELAALGCSWHFLIGWNGDGTRLERRWKGSNDDREGGFWLEKRWKGSNNDLEERRSVARKALEGKRCRLMIGPPQGENPIIRGLCQRRAGRRGGSDRPWRSASLARRLMTLRFRFSRLCTTSALTQHWLSLQSSDHSSTEGAVIVQCCGASHELPQSVSRRRQPTSNRRSAVGPNGFQSHPEHQTKQRRDAT